MARRESHQEAAEDGQVETEEPLSAFEMPLDGSDIDLAPTAMLQRKDGETLFYEGKLNFLFGTPGGGKSWIALHCIQETLLRGQKTVYWDHEDTPSTLNRRSKLLGLDLKDFWQDGEFQVSAAWLGRRYQRAFKGHEGSFGVVAGKRRPSAGSH